jgi:hypothetical protein
MTAPWFTDATGPVDFVGDGLPHPDAEAHRKLYVRDGSRFVEATTSRRHVPAVERFGADGAGLRVPGPPGSRITGVLVVENTSTRVITRRVYDDGAVVWTLRPRRTVGVPIEAYTAGDPRFADLEADYRRRTLTGREG